MKSEVIMMLVLAISRSARCSGDESSDVYLRNVVEELQFLNGVAPSEKSSIRVVSSPYPSYEEDASPSESNDVEVSSSDVITTHHQLSPSQHYQTLPKDLTYRLEPPSLQQQHQQYQQSPNPQSPMVLGFTAAELAAMYRKAIERGVPMKNHHHHHHYQPSSQVAEYSFDKPKVVPALRVQQPTGYGSDYAYYFYPLHSFRHELEKQTSFHPAALPDGYHTLPDASFAATTIVDHGKKETSTGIMSHIINGVSSFIGMAIFFVFSMFIYPRVLHIMNFPFAATSRTLNFRNELGQLAAFVTEAIDAYNQNTRQKSKQLPQR